jgi:rSAM/selenodomain-associated transferase 2
MISIIIPTYNEADQIAGTIGKLQNITAHDDVEIIVSDGGSTDQTMQLAKDSGAIVSTSQKKGRAAQMNAGAAISKGDMLYFLHADTLPPESFLTDIIKAADQGYDAGCFMLSFNYSHWFLKANCWFTRFDMTAVHFGDQSLFVTKVAFEHTNGFCEQNIVLEDQELIKRLRKIVRFKVIKKAVTTSARKYLENGIYKTQGIFFFIYFLYRIGFSQQKLVSTYKKLIRQDKL